MPSAELVITGAKVVTPGGVTESDVVVAEGKIAELADWGTGRGLKQIDASGLHVFPGMIDSHVHFNEPGRSDWEGIATGSSALAAGGGTCFFDMPLNSSPPTLDRGSFELKRAAAERSSMTDFGLWGGLTPLNLQGLEALAECGVIGFKAFMCNSGMDDFPAADEQTLREGMTIARKVGRLVAVHAESEAMTSRLTQAAIKADRKTWKDYLETRPPQAEHEAISRAIDCAADTGCRLHIVHVSTAEGVDLVTGAARRGVDVTCETCPHYLLLKADDLLSLGARAKCAPPLRSEKDGERLCQRVHDGGIAFVASDHSPAPQSMKRGDDAFAIWGGIAGIQSTFLALQGHGLSPQRIAELASGNVARRFGIEGKGAIEVGKDADLVLCDLSQSFVLQREQLFDRHKLSPYVGRRFQGVVRQTILRGQTIFRDGMICGKPAGRFIAGGGHA